jgi:cytochrome c oxidase subunit 3
MSQMSQSEHALDMPPALEELEVGHQFEELGQQAEAYTVGMWIFLITELLFFGGLFTAYIVFRSHYPEMFAKAHEHLDKLMGGINTFVLLTSSFSMALAVRAAQLNKWRQQLYLISFTILCALAFMVVKYFEYSAKIQHGLVPGPNFNEAYAGGPHSSMFFGLYFAMTGLHGFHVLVGIIVMSVLMVRIYRMRNQRQDFIPVEMVGLYWHFVDIVWIFLYPLLYLIGSH